jgi:hypothetical protein
MSARFAQLDYSLDFRFNVFGLNLSDGSKEFPCEELTVRLERQQACTLSESQRKDI